MTQYAKLLPFALLVVVGCQPSGSTAANSPDASGNPSPTATASPDPHDPLAPFTEATQPPKLNADDLQKGFAPAPEVKPMDIGQMADAALAKLKDAECGIYSEINIPAGKGNNRSIVRVRDSQHVRMDYLVLATLDDEKNHHTNPIYSERILKNGSKATQTGPLGLKDISRGLPKPELILVAWPSRFPSLILRSLVDGSTPITTYIQAAKRDSANYDVKVEKKNATVDGKTYSSIRVVVDRKGVALEKLGKAHVAINFEASRHLPITVVSEFQPNGAKPSTIVWHANWHGPLKFDDTEFTKPK